MLLYARRPYGSESVAPWLFDDLAWPTLLSMAGKGATWSCSILALLLLERNQMIPSATSEPPYYMALLLSGKQNCDHVLSNIFWPITKKSFTFHQIAGVILGRQRPKSCLACYKLIAMPRTRRDHIELRYAFDVSDPR
jgi:hypothetical protein